MIGPLHPIITGPLWGDMQAIGVLSGLVFSVGIVEGSQIFKTTPPQLVCQAAGLDPEKHILLNYADPKNSAKAALRVKFLTSLRCTLASLSLITCAAYFAFELSEREKRSRINVLEGKAPFQTLNISPKKNKHSGVVVRICDAQAFSAVLKRNQESVGQLQWGNTAMLPIVLGGARDRKWQWNPLMLKVTKNGKIPVFCKIDEGIEIEGIQNLPVSPSWEVTCGDRGTILMECDFLSGNTTRCPFTSQTQQQQNFEVLQQTLHQLKSRIMTGSPRSSVVRIFLLDHFGAQAYENALLKGSSASEQLHDIVIDGQAVVLKSILAWAEGFTPFHNEKRQQTSINKDAVGSKIKRHYKVDLFETVGCLVQLFFKDSTSIVSGLRQISLLMSGSNKIMTLETDSDQIFYQMSKLLKKHGWYVVRSEFAECFQQSNESRSPEFPKLWYYSCDDTTLISANSYLKNQEALPNQIKSDFSQEPSMNCVIFRNNFKSNFYEEVIHDGTKDVGTPSLSSFEVIYLDETYDGIFDFIRSKLTKGMHPSKINSLLKEALN
eukprot:CAMPEP_0117876696 /NCGR_PEP_ID=MMETSP0950-20121206/13731_1 /TAXON_ID=44440 /ORGANISM="Chattonella subsalsa, Strain CCMP2191" /LENGTH=548 /DNA_ID=CAMNT_0005730507 /DNA_START=136 /DNA_END=1782 /DNA_ORIENTATION=+